MPIGYTPQRREYLNRAPADEVAYETVQFSHPDFGDIYLVANQFTPKSFNVDGNSVEFMPVSMSLPQTTNQTTDVNNAGAIQFGRLGPEFRQKLKLITPRNKFKPIDVTIRIFSESTSVVTYERKLFVARNGISMNEEGVTVRLTLDNPARITRKRYSYTPENTPGLLNV